MRLFAKLSSLVFVLSVALASDPQTNQPDSKQGKRSLTHDEWSSPVVLENTPQIVPAAVGVSTHTDTLTTVREKVPVPFEVIKPVPAPYPV